MFKSQSIWLVLLSILDLSTSQATCAPGVTITETFTLTSCPAIPSSTIFSTTFSSAATYTPPVSFTSSSVQNSSPVLTSTIGFSTVISSSISTTLSSYILPSPSSSEVESTSNSVSVPSSSVFESSTAVSTTSAPSFPSSLTTVTSTSSFQLPSITQTTITTTVVSYTTIQGTPTTVSVVSTFTQLTTVAFPTTVIGITTVTNNIPTTVNVPTTVTQYTTVVPPICSVHPSIENGGFEAGLAPWAINDIGSSSHSLNTNYSNSYVGSNSLHLTFAASSDSTSTIIASQEIPACPGGNYFAKGYVIADADLLATQDTCFVYLEGSGQRSEPVTLQAGGFPGWTFFYVFFTAPVGSGNLEFVTLSVGAYCEGDSGSARGVYVDDFEIQG